MNKSHLEYEEEIKKKKDTLQKSLQELLNYMDEEKIDISILQKYIEKSNKSSSEFFTYYEDTLLQYDMIFFHDYPNTLKMKEDSTVNILNTILKFWRIMDLIKSKYDIVVPKPSERAYSTMQRFLTRFDKEKSKEFKEEFDKLKLPVHGFNDKKNYWYMKMDKQTKLGIILGALFLLLLVGFVIYINGCPTELEHYIFIVILSLAGAAFSMVLTGQITVNYKKLITAGGAMAVFVILFFLKPIQLENYVSCEKNNTLSGSVYYGNDVENGIQLIFITNGAETKTDSYGRFSVLLNNTTSTAPLKIKLQKKEI